MNPSVLRNRIVLLVLFINTLMCGQGIPIVNRPRKIPFQADLLQRLKVPTGFHVNVFASNTGEPRMMAVGPDGSVYVTRPEQGDLIRLMDKNGDGKADQSLPIVKGIRGLHGIHIEQTKLYLAGVNEVYVSDLEGKNLKKLIGDLPDGGQHPNRTVGVGPDGLLYISIGSTCNNCIESSNEHATILQTQLDGSRRKIFAKGLRNTIGFDWHPQTREFWGMDHGSDGRGDNLPFEELNRLLQNSDYGWPFCYGNKEPDPLAPQPKGITKKEYCKNTIPITLGYQAHSAPIEMIFYNSSQFPAEYRGDAFVAMHGSWNRSSPVGFKVVRIRFQKGVPRAFEDFLTGFLISQDSQFGRPAGLAVTKDGALLISDDDNGMIYRVSYNPK